MATTIELTIQDANITRVLTTFTELAGKQIELMVRVRDINANWLFSFEPKQGGETNKQFATRVAKEIVRRTKVE